MSTKLMSRQGRKFILIGLLLFDSALAEIKEVVHLKNGSVIKGLILEQVPGQTLKLQTGDGSVFVFKMEEVEKIGREETAPALSPAPSIYPAPVQPQPMATVASTSSVSMERPLRRDRPFSFHIKGGFGLPGEVDYDVESEYVDLSCTPDCRETDSESGSEDLSSNLSILSSVEMKVGSNLGIGIGAGYFSTMKLDDSDDDDGGKIGTIMPLFGITRLSIPMSPVASPFLLLNMGYGLFFPDDDDEEVGQTNESNGGLFWGVGGGMIFSIPGLYPKLSLESNYSVANFGLDFESRGSDYRDTQNGDFSVSKVTFQAGLVF